MEKKIKLFVVRFSFGAEVYGSLDDAKAVVGSYLSGSSFDTVATIECYRSVGRIVEGRQWISHYNWKITTREEFDNATENERLEFFAKNFTKNFAKKGGCGYMREDVYTFCTVCNKGAENELYGSLNGRPISVDGMRNYQRTPMYLARF